MEAGLLLGAAAVAQVRDDSGSHVSGRSRCREREAAGICWWMGMESREIQSFWPKQLEVKLIFTEKTEEQVYRSRCVGGVVPALTTSVRLPGGGVKSGYMQVQFTEGVWARPAHLGIVTQGAFQAMEWKG